MKEEDRSLLKLFQCDYNRSLEEDFARTLSEDDGIRLFFINENRAFTDGRNIVVDPADAGLFCDVPALEKAAEYMELPREMFCDPWDVLRLVTRGQTIHECLHILYTDFSLKPYITENCDTEIKRKTIRMIENIIEDAYIEAAGCSAYDNMEVYLQFGRIARLFVSNPPKSTTERVFEDVKDKTLEITAYLEHMAVFLLYPMLIQEEPSAELLSYIEETKPLFLEGSVQPSAEERFAYTVKIYESILPLIPETQEEWKDERLKQLLFGHRSHEGEVQTLSSKKTGGRVQEITRRLFTDREGSLRAHRPSLAYVRAILAGFAKDRKEALKSLEGEAWTVFFSGKNYEASVLHRNISVHENHPKPDHNLRRAYENICRRYQVKINSYNTRFDRLLRSEVSVREEKLSFGAGISSKRLSDPSKRYWYRTVSDVDVPDVSILLLIDGSGSMSGKKCQEAMNASIILHEVLNKQSVAHAIVEHRGGFDEPYIEMNILVDFHAREEEKYNLLNIDADGDNRDALALLWAERYLLQKAQSESRVMIVISDGVPAHEYDDYYPPVSTKDTANTVRKILKRGTRVIAISLDEEGHYSCYDNLKEIYPHLIACNNLEKLTGQLLELIAKLL